MHVSKQNVHAPTKSKHQNVGSRSAGLPLTSLPFSSACYHVQIQGSLHYGGKYPKNLFTERHTAQQAGTEAAFHTYAVEWELGKIRWLLDGVPFGVALASTSRNDGGYFSSGPGAGRFSPFDKPFHLILNLALGSESTAFTRLPGGAGVTEAQLRDRLQNGGDAKMVVDWVRVYGCSADPGQPCEAPIA